MCVWSRASKRENSTVSGHICIIVNHKPWLRQENYFGHIMQHGKI